MDLAYAYHQIEERLATIDFAVLHQGFSRFPFALYNNEKAYMDGETFDKPTEFMGNTSVMYKGNHTAIWYLPENPQDYDVLASKLVHEMLHAFQHASGESRWADERAALVKYRYDEVNFAARLDEAECMSECLHGDSPEAFARLLSLRKARSERFPYVYDYEARIEQIEGTAHFVELSALAQLNAEKAKSRWENLFAELKDPAKYFPVRAVTYLSGAAFIACLRKYTDLQTDRFTGTPFSIEAIEQAQPCALPENNPLVEACLVDWQKKFQEVVTKALEKGDLVLEGEDYRLIMWNVYDGTWDGKYAILSAFLGYIEGKELPTTDEEFFAQMKVINGNFVAELDEDFHLFRVWRQ